MCEIIPIRPSLEPAFQKLRDFGLLDDEAYLRDAIGHALAELRAGDPDNALKILEFAIREQGQ